MIRLYALVTVVGFALMVFCVVDIIGTPAERIRNLPKTVWLLLVLFFPLVGSIAWLAVGRPERTAPRQRRPERAAPDFPEYDRPGRAAAADPEKDEEFLRRIKARAEEQRKRYEASRKDDPEPDLEA